ncbi:MAG: hypothetical protein HYT72_00480 [Candidatus Aenigmarchaeota archaeon]|nr:hypothetical protein [Candidatus Aenigmarchaeota archaeon]
MYDVIISGCGVAGGYLAGLLDGLDVLVLEKNRHVTLKDSGLVSAAFSRFATSKLIQSKVYSMKAVSPSGLTFMLNSKKPFAYILKRKAFSGFLRRRAKTGARLRYEMARKISYSKNGVHVETENGTYEGKMIIGADGTLSTVRRNLGIKLPAVLGIFARAEKKLSADTIEVYLNKFFSPDFFSWIIPQTKEYGIITRIRPRNNFEYFKNTLNLPDGRMYSSYIPIGYCKSYAQRTLLVGDACGQVKPLTGGGIMFSMRAAKHAARIIRLAAEKDRFDANFLSRYEILWKRELAWEIKRQLLLRRVYRRLTNRDIDKIFITFGHSISKINEFDYDKLTDMWKKLPKMELLKFAVTKLPLVF